MTGTAMIRVRTSLLLGAAAVRGRVSLVYADEWLPRKRNFPVERELGLHAITALLR